MIGLFGPKREDVTGCWTKSGNKEPQQMLLE